MREIVLDTETTGFDPQTGDRIVEIGAVEIIDKLPTGQTYHQYINPERDMPESAFRVHGLSSEFLSDKPVFALVAAEFLQFIEDSPLVIHNASFDMKFINFELERIGAAAVDYDRAVDTLAIAQRRFPGSPASLDALCRRFQVDNSKREKHGALLDSELLAEVYLHLMGGRQTNLELANSTTVETRVLANRQVRAARIFPIAKAEEKAHAEFVSAMPNALWNNE